MASNLRIFLSRTTKELGWITGRIIDLANKGAFPNLEIVDQEYLCRLENMTKSMLTVSKLESWIKDSDRVLLLVGTEAGSTIDTSLHDGSDPGQNLSAKTQEIYEKLLATIAHAGIMPAIPSYTQLEGVIAFALDKNPYIYQLEVPCSDSLQLVYRQWLDHYYKSPRDRLTLSNTTDLESTLIEGLQREDFSESLDDEPSDQSLWDTVEKLSDKDKPSDVKKAMTELREFRGECLIDWIDSIPFQSRESAKSVHRGFPVTKSDAQECWLLVFESDLVVLNGNAGWSRHEIQKGETVIDITFDGLHFWILSRINGKVHLRSPQANRDIRLKNLDDYITTNFAAVHLSCLPGEADDSTGASSQGHRNSEFFFRKGNDSFQIDLQTKKAERLDRDAPPDSMSLIRYRIPDRFPFHRSYTGYTIDHDIEHRWALLEDKEEGCAFIRFSPGRFSDLFLIAEVELPGTFEIDGVVLERDEIAYLPMAEESSHEVVQIPMFAFSTKGGFRDEHCTEFPGILGSPKPLGVQRRKIVRRKKSADKPFCFIEISELNEGRTVVKVWLIPEEPSKELVHEMQAYVSGLDCRPHPLFTSDSIGSLDLADAPGDSQWWNLLWRDIKGMA